MEARASTEKLSESGAARHDNRDLAAALTIHSKADRRAVFTDTSVKPAVLRTIDRCNSIGNASNRPLKRALNHFFFGMFGFADQEVETPFNIFMRAVIRPFIEPIAEVA